MKLDEVCQNHLMKKYLNLNQLLPTKSAPLHNAIYPINP